MEDEVIHQRYRELACAVIAQGISDWLKEPVRRDYSLYRWMNKCPWFDYLGLDREYVYAKALKLREKGVRSVSFHNYGKVNNIRNESEESGEHDNE